MKALRYNINSKVWVKLNDLGVEHIVKHYNRVLPYTSQVSYGEIASRINKYGYHEFQMWSFIEQFGEVTGMGMNSHYSNDIILFESDLNEIKL